MKAFLDRLKGSTWKQKWRIINYNLRHNEVCSPYPLSAKIEINGSCNLDCIMCLRKKLPHRDRYMSIHEFETILNNCPSLIEFAPHGYNEPLLHPRFFNLIKIGNERGLGWSLITNATRLNSGSILRQLLAIKPRLIRVSIDAGEKDRYEEIRRGGNFDNVIENVRNLSIMSRHCGIDLALYTTIWNGNVDQIPSLVRLAKRLQLPITFNDITWQNEYGESNHENSIRENWTNEEIRTIIKPYEGMKGITFSLGKILKRTCHLPWTSFYCDVSGTVFPCTDNLDKPMGNLLETPIGEIFNSEDYQEFRTRSLNGEIESCKNCLSWAPVGGRA